MTLLHRLSEWAAVSPTQPAQRYKVGNEWKSISSSEFRDRVYHLALFLESKGFGPNSVGSIYSYNCPQWTQLELAFTLLCGKSTGIYPNSTPKDISYILNHTQSQVLAVQNEEYYWKLFGGKEEQTSLPLPASIKVVIVFEGDTSFHPGAIRYIDSIKLGEKRAKEKGAPTFKNLLEKLDPKGDSFIIFTSGTTGNPKGAILSHDNMIYTSDIVEKHWSLPKGSGDLFSFLPLCHIAEKLQNLAVGISQNYTVNFCSRFENVSKELPEVKPTLLLSVPRLWEKMMEGVNTKIQASPPTKKRLAEWALGVTGRLTEAKLSDRMPNPLDLIQAPLAHALVISKIREAMGLSRVVAAASGAAALAPHIAKWFRRIGVQILEDFGQTESTGVICMTERDRDGAGSVGRPLDGTEFKIAEDGEILTRGRHVFKGYFKDPEATAKTLIDGWLHTGDLGFINPAGYVQIRGRKKEILKTSGGKMIAPLPIEEAIKAEEIISQVCIVGDGRKYLSALITLSEPTLLKLGKIRGSIKDGFVVDEESLATVKKRVSDINADLASYEQIKRFTVIGREFSIQDGEMTPTLKMKRNVIEKNFKDVIDSMYTGASKGD